MRGWVEGKTFHAGDRVVCLSFEEDMTGIIYGEDSLEIGGEEHFMVTWPSGPPMQADDEWWQASHVNLVTRKQRRNNQ